MKEFSYYYKYLIYVLLLLKVMKEIIFIHEDFTLITFLITTQLIILSLIQIVCFQVF